MPVNENSINTTITSDETITENYDTEQLDNVDQFIEMFKETKDSANKPDKIEMACALLAAFFGGKMTQHALSLVLKFVNILTNGELPKRFDELSKIILSKNEDKIKYNKKWYCCICKIFVSTDNRFQRTCNNCKERFLKTKLYYNTIIFLIFVHYLDFCSFTIWILKSKLKNYLRIVCSINQLKQVKTAYCEILSMVYSTKNLCKVELVMQLAERKHLQ